MAMGEFADRARRGFESGERCQQVSSDESVRRSLEVK
jgi:hypothetical protein